MEIGMTVRFASHRRWFLVTDSYCRNPDCPCNEVILDFSELTEGGNQRAERISFGLRVQLESWQESEPGQRPPEVAEWVREFLENCPADRKAEFKSRYEGAKQHARRLAEFRIDPADVFGGVLVSYADISSEDGALSHGGRSCTYRFHYDGRVYLIEDQYCPNPECHCNEVYVQVWEDLNPQSQAGEPVSISELFRGKVTFDGKLEVVHKGACRGDEAHILAAWWAKCRDDLEIFRERYDAVKEIGQRSLDGAPCVDTPLHEPSPLAFPDETRTDKIRIGRNDPCPCGSGKKFKKCCWRKGEFAV